MRPLRFGQFIRRRCSCQTKHGAQAGHSLLASCHFSIVGELFASDLQCLPQALEISSRHRLPTRQASFPDRLSRASFWREALARRVSRPRQGSGSICASRTHLSKLTNQRAAPHIWPSPSRKGPRPPLSHTRRGLLIESLCILGICPRRFSWVVSASCLTPTVAFIPSLPTALSACPPPRIRSRDGSFRPLWRFLCIAALHLSPRLFIHHVQPLLRDVSNCAISSG